MAMTDVKPVSPRLTRVQWLVGFIASFWLPEPPQRELD